MKNKNIKPEENQVKNNRKKGHYSLLTFVLLLCIVELAFSSFQNINKNFKFNSKIKELENKRNEEKAKNNQLKSDIENFDSNTTLESIARNNLKMAGEDEILILINQPENETIQEPQVKNNFFYRKNK